METLKGTVDRLIFHNADDGFSIFILNLSAAHSALVKGYFPVIHAGEEVSIEGDWIFHKKFGKQFHAKKCVTQLPTTIVGLKKYLSSGLIKGIGPVYAKKIVDTFGIQTLEIIEKSSHELHKIPGIGQKRIELIIKGYQEQKDISHLMIFLQEREISPVFAAKIYKTYGDNAISILHENPYRLADDIWGVGFKTADIIAQKLGFDPHSIKRVEAALIFSITQHSKTGNLYIEIQTLKQQASTLINLPETETEKLKIALHNLHETQRIKVLTVNEKHFITLSVYYFTEKGVASTLKNLFSAPSSLSFNIDKIYQDLRVSQTEIQLHENQQRGIIASLTNKVSIITGGPGTGKTTLIKKLLNILDLYGCRYKLAAPTGRAAKRMMEGTGRHALTIHRLLEFDASNMSFKHNERNALKLDILILDEASMIDIFLAHALLKALPLSAHIIFLGDIDQLPAVGAGNFLNDLITSKSVPCTRLTHIFRQAQDSLIIVNAHRVNNGDFPTSYQPEAKRDFIYIKEQDAESVPQHLKTIFSHTLKKYSIAPDEAIVLAPMNKGIVGTMSINFYLQEMLNNHNKKRGQLAYAGNKYQLGDRVMQIRNNYDKGVFNGDIGTISSLDLDKQNLIVDYSGKFIEYDINEIDELVLAYAISIHKSQGSEFKAAIIPIFMQHYTLLQRNLIYTALTRAKFLCILIGQPKAIAMAVKNNKSTERITFLHTFLTQDLEAR